MKLYEFTKSYEMLEKARKYVPNGIYGPRSPMFLTYGSYPAFIASGEGCRIRDVDGNEYIDYMCSFGTNLLGLRHPRIDAAARTQWEKGDCFTLPSDLWVPLAEKMVKTIDSMGWCVFGKNGSDVTSYGITVARIATGRKKILAAHGSYHGAHFWCQPHGEGVPDEWKAHVHYFHYNDAEDFGRLIDQYAGEIAAVILTPHQHDAFADQHLPTPEFVAAVNRLAKDNGFLIIIDDVRCGFRLNLSGSAAHYGFQADLNCFGKAMANGYAIAVAMGTPALIEAAKKTYFTGTHFFSGVSFAAALAAIDEIESSGAIEKIRQMGTLLQSGLSDAAASNGVKVNVTGPPAMPFMTFANDPGFEKNRLFCGEAARRGIFFHPHHNWFVCAAVTEADIQKTLDVADACFRIAKDSLGG